ncbi:hypothetical protein P7C70_g5386, partial [Phenoliferia sp. Uapishka_3]
MAYEEFVEPSTGPVRSSARLTSASSNQLLNSPSTTRSGRQLGAVGGKNGPGYSPYARRSYPRDPSTYGANGDEVTRSEDEVEMGGSTLTPSASVSGGSGGLVGMVKSLPGKALGFLWRGGRKGLTDSHRSQSMADLQSEARIEATGAARGNGLPRSTSTSAQLASQSRSQSRFGGGAPPPKRSQLSTSASMSSLPPPVSLRKPIPYFEPPPFAPSSTLHPPSGPSSAPFLKRSRAPSPALSSGSRASLSGNRSPSPVRAKLAGSISAFNLSS